MDWDVESLRVGFEIGLVNFLDDGSMNLPVKRMIIDVYKY